MRIDRNRLIDIEVCLDKIQAYEGAKIIDPDYSGSLTDGIEDALITVAKAHRIGAVVKKDPDKAIKYLSDAIRLGKRGGDAAKELGDIFRHDDWWGKKSYNFSWNDCYESAINLWEKEAEQGRSESAWSLYNIYRQSKKDEAEKWSSIAINLAKKSGDYESVNFMESVLNEKK